MVAKILLLLVIDASKVRRTFCLYPPHFTTRTKSLRPWCGACWMYRHLAKTSRSVHYVQWGTPKREPAKILINTIRAKFPAKAIYSHSIEALPSWQEYILHVEKRHYLRFQRHENSTLEKRQHENACKISSPNKECMTNAQDLLEKINAYVFTQLIFIETINWR